MEQKLIDREKLRMELRKLFASNPKLIDRWLANAVEDEIDDAPTIDAEPIRRGEWLHNDIMETDICSCCHTLLECDVRGFNYCPYCGAKMDEANDGFNR